MRRLSIHREDEAELNQLFEALPAAISRASKVLKAKGSIHESYLAENAKVGQIHARINLLMNE